VVPVDWRRDLASSGWELATGPAATVAIELPEVAVGGEPIGTADVVRLDPETGQETGRVHLAGRTAVVQVGADAVWTVSVVVPDRSSAPLPATLEVTRIDAATFRPTGTLQVPSTWASQFALAGDIAWLHDATGLHRLEGPVPHVTGTVASLGPASDEESLVAAPNAVVVQRSAGDLLVDPRSLDVRPVDAPSGIVASGDLLWSVGVAGAVQRLDAGLAPVGARRQLQLATVDTASGDGRGGVWVPGTAIGWSDLPGGESVMVLDAVRRPIAIHLARDGKVDRTVMAYGSGPAPTSWFSAVGSRVALWTSDAVLLFDPHLDP
jgi:hypothetical protein